MKRWFSIVFFVGMVAFSACNRPVETRHGTSLPTDMSPELSAIDSLMWQRPDSALRCLLPYFDTCCRDVSRNVSGNTNDVLAGDVSGNVSTTNDCHYANLLLAELLYKNDNPQLNRAELLQAVDYYDSLCCRDAARHVPTDPILMFLDARAHYINGVGFYERDSVVEACQEYLKALELMEDCFDEVEIIGNKANLTALLFAHLTGVFSDQYLHEQSIYFGNKTLKYFKKYDAISWNVSWVLNEIGSHYDVLGDYDSAGYYYNQGLFLLSDTNNLNYRDLTTRLAFLSYKH
jgi:tetratricopeptide (TPR) repeat protein